MVCPTRSRPTQAILCTNKKYTLFCSSISGDEIPETVPNSKPHCPEENCSERHAVLSPVIAALIDGTSDLDTLLSPLDGQPLAEHEQGPKLKDLLNGVRVCQQK